MQPPHQHLRINVAELKAQIVKKLGPDGSKQYFYYLNRFLSSKLNKIEFSKLCFKILGRENLPLHNHFIRSILRNACTAKAPPSVSHTDDVRKHGTQVTGKETSVDRHEQNGSHAAMVQASGSPGLSNGGYILPVSPRKARSGVRDRRTGDRRSALGPYGKASVAPQLPIAAQSSDFNGMLENRDLNPPDILRPVQHHYGLMQQAENGNEIFIYHPDKISDLSRSRDDSDPVYRKDQSLSVVRNDGKEASARSPLRAPLGVPLCSVSIGGGRKVLPLPSSTRCIDTSNDCALLDSLTLRERMEQIALSQGLEGVSMDSANILNNGLDLYLKGLLRSCIELAGPRSGHELIKNNTYKHPMCTKLINGFRPGHQYQIQNGGISLKVQEKRAHLPISLQDFKAAMDLNPRQLGEDWPLLLEKISICGFEE